MAPKYTPPEPGNKIIIVGGGAFGLSTAYALSLKDKYEVWVFDRQPIPAPDAASSDINKIMRFDYAQERMYMELTLESLPYWHQWNEERAEQGLSPLFHNTGVLLFSQNGQFSDYERLSMKYIREAGYGHAIEELRTPESIIKRYPQFKGAVANGFDIAYVNKLGGWVDSTESVKHIYQKCVANGVHFVTGMDAGCMDQLVCEGEKVLGIQTKDKVIHRADRVVLATGSWTPGLVDTGKLLVATGQAVIHFQVPEHLMGKVYGNGTEPGVWAGDLSRTGFYGFAPNKDGKMKVGYHSRGYLNPREGDGVSVPRTQVTNACDTIPVDALRRFREFLGKFMPETTEMDISYSRICWYCDAFDGHYLVSPHPGYENLIIASGDSGHGLKFIPNLGFKICHVIEGIDSDWSRQWAWRDVLSKATTDGLRADWGGRAQLNLCEGDCRMVTQEELQASAKARL